MNKSLQKKASRSMQVYVFGNGNISFDDFATFYRDPLSSLVVREDVTFIVCDFRGTDTLAMEYFKCMTGNVRLFHMGERPRYMPDSWRTRVSEWKLVGGFSSDSARDAAASAACTHFLARDSNSTAGRKSGTLRNIEHCLKRGALPLDLG